MQPTLTILGFTTFIGNVVQTDYPCNVPASVSDPLPLSYAVALSDGADPKTLAAVVIVKSNVPQQAIVPGIAEFVRAEPRLAILIRSKLIATAARLELPENTSPDDAAMRVIARGVFETFPP